MANPRLILAVAGGVAAFALTTAAPVKSDSLRSTAAPASTLLHTHVCPCWVADDASSQQQPCSCGSHKAFQYGLECSTDESDATGGSPGGSSPVGSGPVGIELSRMPLSVTPLGPVRLSAAKAGRARCATLSADGKVTMAELAEWKRLNCAQFYP